MKEPGNNNKNSEMEDFLRRANEGRLEDDFEREAAEGFKAMSHEEIMAAKSSVDRKTRRLFGESPALRVGWSMAAGVALIVGLTVYFLRDDVFPQKDLAMELPPGQTEVRADPRSPTPPDPGAATLQFKDSMARGQESEQDEARPSKAAANSKVTKNTSPEKLQELSAGTATEEEPSTEFAAAAPKSNHAEPPADDMENAPEEKVAANVPLASSGAAGNVSPQREAEAASRNKDRASHKKLKRAEAVPQPSARADMEVSSSMYYATDSTTLLILQYLKKNLPANLNRQFAATLMVNELGQLGDALVQEGHFSQDEKKALTALLNASEVKEIKNRKLVKQPGKISLVYVP